MKKSLIAITIVLLVTGALFASSSWIGAQGTVATQKHTTTSTIFRFEFEQENTKNQAGLNIEGTIYPGDSSVGIGFQAGGSKIFKATNNDTEVTWSDYPPTMNIGALAKFKIGMSEMLALELGAGLMYERTTTTYDFGLFEARTDLNTLSVLTAADVVVHIGDSLALIGGVGVSFPLTTQGTYTDNFDTSIKEDFDVKGYTFSGKVGVGLSF